MATVFTRIIAGELPGRFIWADEVCVAFLTINPLTPGHVLVVTRAQIAQWTDVSEPTAARLMQVAQMIARAQQAEWGSPRVGLMAQGFDVPHVHLHVWPAFSATDFDLRQAQDSPEAAVMDSSAARLRAQLHTQLAGTGEAEHITA